jgi:ubiquinone/menaquinone biosynthesis C-methylase UbiE
MMVDLSQLSPGEMAKQLGRPTGEVGIGVGDYMSKFNARLIKAAFGLLAPPAKSRVLEVGFGNGRLIGEMLLATPDVAYTGVEVSSDMMLEAERHNRALIEQGKVELHLASVESLPFPDAIFDRAIAINTIYFWPDQVRALAEIQRSLRSRGLLVVASMTPETAERSAAAKPEFGFNVPSRDALKLLHQRAGFGQVRFDYYEEQAKRLDGTTQNRAYNIVLAQPD